MLLKYIVLYPRFILANINTEIETIASKLGCIIKNAILFKILFWFIFVVNLEIVGIKIILNLLLAKQIEIGIICYDGRAACEVLVYNKSFIN